MTSAGQHHEHEHRPTELARRAIVKRPILTWYSAVGTTYLLAFHIYQVVAK